MNTIAAIATPTGKGAISIIRISGSESLKILSACFKSRELEDISDMEPRRMYLGTFFGGEFKEKCFAVYFRAPHSYTGEDMVEIQCHGGVRLTHAVLDALLENGAALASKGEFTRRAFLNGKVDLSEAEGIVDMINAESIASVRAGYNLMNGILTDRISELCSKILDVCALLEADLDFPEDTDEAVRADVSKEITDINIDLKSLLRTSKAGRAVKNGVNIAIIGRPNVGKSSLLNAMTAKDRAIVTEIAGTTRDVIEERFEYKGILLNILDTAGLRETGDPVEKIGVDRAEKCADAADAVLLVFEATQALGESDEALINKYKDKNSYIVFNKCDLGLLPSNKERGLAVSAKQTINIENLLDLITADFDEIGAENHAMLTEIRHIDAIERAYDFMKSANNASFDTPTECLLIDLRSAYNALGEISGLTASEDIIDKVFEKFCLGK